MKKIIGLFLLFRVGVFSATAIDLQLVRAQYEKAVTDKAVCKNMIEILEKEQTTSIHLAYLGAYQAIWAGHVLNPVEKLRTFERGKQNIEKAIQQNQQEPEIRFLRLSIQQNCPVFLGYHNQIESDKNYLIKNKSKIQSPLLSRMITDVLKK